MLYFPLSCKFLYFSVLILIINSIFYKLGVAIDGPDAKTMALIKKSGKVKQLEEEIANRKNNIIVAFRLKLMYVFLLLTNR